MRVQPHQQLALPDGLSLIGRNLSHGSGYLRRQLNQIAVDVGIRGGDVVTPDGQVIDQCADADQDQDRAEDGDDDVVALLVVGCLFRVLLV